MARRANTHPTRPLNRISSTFVSDDRDILTLQFWHLSSDPLVDPIPELRRQADERFGQQKEYGQMLVGDQVQRQVKHV